MAKVRNDKKAIAALIDATVLNKVSLTEDTKVEVKEEEIRLVELSLKEEADSSEEKVPSPVVKEDTQNVASPETIVSEEVTELKEVVHSESNPVEVNEITSSSNVAASEIVPLEELIISEVSATTIQPTDVTEFPNKEEKVLHDNEEISVVKLNDDFPSLNAIGSQPIPVQKGELELPTSVEELEDPLMIGEDNPSKQYSSENSDLNLTEEEISSIREINERHSNGRVPEMNLPELELVSLEDENQPYSKAATDSGGISSAMEEDEETVEETIPFEEEPRKPKMKIKEIKYGMTVIANLGNYENIRTHIEATAEIEENEDLVPSIKELSSQIRKIGREEYRTIKEKTLKKEAQSNTRPHTGNTNNLGNPQANRPPQNNQSNQQGNQPSQQRSQNQRPPQSQQGGHPNNQNRGSQPRNQNSQPPRNQQQRPQHGQRLQNTGQFGEPPYNPNYRQ